MGITAQFIAPQGGGFEPQRAYNFELHLFGAPGEGNLCLSVSEAFLPEVSSDPIELSYMAEKRKVTRQINFRDGQVMFVDYLDKNIYGSILQWRKLVHDPSSGVVGYASEYKKKAAIFLVDPHGASRRVMTIDGIWPSSVNGGQLSYEGSALVKVNVTFTFDRAIAEF